MIIDITGACDTGFDAVCMGAKKDNKLVYKRIRNFQLD